VRPLGALVDELVVAITPDGFRSDEFRLYFSEVPENVLFEPVLTSARTDYPLRERLRLFDELKAFVNRIAQDYLYISTADPYTSAMAIRLLTGVRRLHRKCRAEVAIHCGLGAQTVC
jgi:hypothetical protein